MDSVYLILIATCIFAPFMLYLHNHKRVIHSDNRVQLYRVEAGPTRHLFNFRKNLMSKVEVDLGNISINPELQYFVVTNQCMQVKGISEGDIIGVRMFKEGYCLPSPSEKGRILLIFLDDDHFKGYKIREQGEMTSDGKAYNTFHYKGGTQNMSSKPHSISSIKGFVEEVYQREYVELMR